MKMIAPTVALLSFLVASPAVAEEKIDLRGPAPNAGDVLILTTSQDRDETSQPMQFEVGDPENPDNPDTPEIEDKPLQHEVTITQSMRQKITLQIHILETTDGEATKVETRFLGYNRVSEQSVKGLPNSDPTRYEDKSWQDALVTATKTRNGWETDTQGAGKKVSDIYLVGTGYTDPRLAYPADPVEVGQEWETRYENLPYLFRLEKLDRPEGGQATIKFKLSEIKKTKQGKVAVIEYSYTKKFEDEDITDKGEFRQTGTQKGVGRIERNLETYVDTVSYESMTQVQTQLTPGDVKIKMTSNKIIPITIKSVQQRAEQPKP